jgi:tRNA dimethylallyltransferase
MAKAWILVGATATGKTATANELARRTGHLLISADSMLVYKGMNIGTAKPTLDELAGIDFRGADLVAPNEPFSTGKWVDAAKQAFAEAEAQNRGVIVAGGTGLYVSALLKGLDIPGAENTDLRERLNQEYATGGINALWQRLSSVPEALEAMPDKENPRRVIRMIELLEAKGEAAVRSFALQLAQEADVSKQPVIVGLWAEPELLKQRIEKRAREMFQNGLLEEVKLLREQYPNFSSTAGSGIGYQEAQDALDGKCSVEEAIERTIVRTRQLAKRQRTWFRHQNNVKWVSAPNSAIEVCRVADKIMEVWNEYGPAEVKV